MDWKNRREHPRVDFEHRGEAAIEVRLVVDIVDISAGGLAFKTDQPLEADTTCRLVLFHGNIFVEARILSCRRLSRKRPRYRVSGRFTRVSGQLMEEILRMGEQISARNGRLEHHVHTLREHTVPEILIPATLTPDGIARLRELVENFLDDGMVNLVLDLAHTRDLAPPVLNLLAEMNDEAREEGGQLMLVHCHSRILSALQVAQLASDIPIFESVERALESVRAAAEDGTDDTA